MDLVLRLLTTKALLTHPGQILTSPDLVVIKWKTKGHTLNHIQGSLVAFQRFTSWMLQMCCLCLFFSEDLLISPPELLKGTFSQLLYKSGICPFSNPQYSCVHLGGCVPCIVSITMHILFILSLSKDLCCCVAVWQLLCTPPAVAEMISAPVLCLKILGGGNGLSMLENIDLFPILHLAVESHGSGMRGRPANSLSVLAASLMYVLFI